MPEIEIEFELDEQIFAKTEKAAAEMKVSQNQFFVLAVEEFLDRHDAAVIQAINEAHADYDSTSGEESEEQFVARKMKEKTKRFLADPW